MWIDECDMCASFFSCATELYGSLLRVSEWYSGRIDILCQDSTAK